MVCPLGFNTDDDWTWGKNPSKRKLLAGTPTSRVEGKDSQGQIAQGRLITAKMDGREVLGARSAEIRAVLDVLRNIPAGNPCAADSPSMSQLSLAVRACAGEPPPPPIGANGTRRPGILRTTHPCTVEVGCVEWR